MKFSKYEIDKAVDYYYTQFISHFSLPFALRIAKRVLFRLKAEKKRRKVKM